MSKIEHTLNEKFWTMVDGGEAHLFYRRGPQNSLDIFSVEVPVESRGKNIADQLVREALKHAKNEGVKVIPTCPYVSRWFERHKDEAGILLR